MVKISREFYDFTVMYIMMKSGDHHEQPDSQTDTDNDSSGRVSPRPRPRPRPRPGPDDGGGESSDNG